MNRLPIFLIATVVSAGCASPTALLSGDPSHYLATIDQLPQAGFYVQDAAHAISASEAAHGDSSATSARNQHHLGAAASERFFRDVGPLSLSNGPVDILSQVERYTSASDAQSVLTSDSSSRDKLKDGITLSTGPLGDSAHCDQIIAAAPDGTQLVEFIVEWRVQNVLNTIFLRGRAGATRLVDTLVIAQRQTANEGGATPIPTATG